MFVELVKRFADPLHVLRNTSSAVYTPSPPVVWAHCARKRSRTVFAGTVNEPSQRSHEPFTLFELILDEEDDPNRLLEAS